MADWVGFGRIGRNGGAIDPFSESILMIFSPSTTSIPPPNAVALSTSELPRIAFFDDWRLGNEFGTDFLKYVGNFTKQNLRHGIV